MSDPIFPDGIRVYPPNDGAPDFVKGALVIDSLKFAAWLGQQPDKTVRLDIKLSRKGPLYLQLNTYQRKNTEPVPGCPQPETAWKPAASGGGNPALVNESASLCALTTKLSGRDPRSGASVRSDA